jgi:dolichol-phosphate mannosyltransferase
VGANLVRRLLEDGHRVVAAIRPGADRWRLDEVAGDVELAEVDIRSSESVEALVSRAQPEWLFHLATYGAYSWQDDVRQMHDTNVVGSVNVLRAARSADVVALVGAGSSSEYGLKDHPASELERLEPNSEYAVTKAAAGHLAAHYGRALGMPSVWLRLYSAYGPFEDPRRFVPTLLTSALAGRLPPLVAPETARDFIHVDDVCAAFVAAAGEAERTAGEVFNVGTGVQSTVGDAVAIVKTLLDVEEEPRWHTHAARAWDTDSWQADVSKISDRLGWSATHDLRSGLTASLHWLQEHGRRPSRYGDAG